MFMCMYFFRLQHNKKGKMERKKRKEKTIIYFKSNFGSIIKLNKKSNVKMGTGLQKCEN